MKPAQEKLIVAIDVHETEKVYSLVNKLRDHVKYFKVGMELHNALGPKILEGIYSLGGRVFLDLKFHDIPSTVARAASVVTGHGVFMFNVHAAGGLEMMRATVRAATERAEQLRIPRPILLGMTVLTSIDERILREEMGLGRTVEEQVVFWSRLSQEAGMDGVVASPREIHAVRRACGPDFVIVTPGIRPTWARSNDQRRVMTPGEAIRAGADYLVIGRPITEADDPAEAARRILAEMEEGV